MSKKDAIKLSALVLLIGLVPAVLVEADDVEDEPNGFSIAQENAPDGLAVVADVEIEANGFVVIRETEIEPGGIIVTREMVIAPSGLAVTREIQVQVGMVDEIEVEPYTVVMH